MVGMLRAQARGMGSLWRARKLTFPPFCHAGWGRQSRPVRARMLDPTAGPIAWSPFCSQERHPKRDSASAERCAWTP
jgi:hypothetical protein